MPDVAENRRDAAPDRGVANSASARPVAENERVELIDVVRGFALFGVFMVNTVWLSQDVVLTDARKALLPTPGLDEAVRRFILFFFDTKFITLFSFLFGLGFSIQLERRGADMKRIYARRLVFLLALGLAHGYLLWYGDILQYYALLGFALLWAGKWSIRTLVVWGVLLGAIVPGVLMTVGGILDPDAVLAFIRYDDLVKETRFGAFTGGDYATYLRENAKFYAETWTSGAFIGFLPIILGRFFLGVAAGKARLLQESDRRQPFFRRLAAVGFVVGVLGLGVEATASLLADRGVAAPAGPLKIASFLPGQIGVLGMAAFYVSALAMLWQSPAWRRRLEPLAPVGRMALTNYLTQTVVNVTVWYGFGLALSGKVGAALCPIYCIVVFAAQAAFSRWWLARFRFGPMEWLWRSWTYARWQPLRIDAS